MQYSSNVFVQDYAGLEIKRAIKVPSHIYYMKNKKKNISDLRKISDELILAGILQLKKFQKMKPEKIQAITGLKI